MAADQERRRRNAGAGILYALVDFVAHDALEEVSHCRFGVTMIHPIFRLLLHLIGQRGVILVISAFFLSTVIVVFTRRHAKTVAAFIF
jgi:hypothetical protein